MRTLQTSALALCISLVVTGCSSGGSNQTSPFNSELYAGKPVDTLSSEAPPANEKEAIMRGDSALREQDLDLALYEYIRSLNYPEKQYHDKTLLMIGQIHQSRFNVELAEKAYLAAINFNPENTDAIEALGLMYTKQGRVDDAKGYFVMAINQDQKRLNSGIAFNTSSISVESVNALSIDADSPEVAYMGLGVYADVEREHTLAQEYFRKCLAIDARSVKGLVNMGYSKYMSGEYVDARRLNLAALQIEPDNEKALNNLALIHLAKNDPQSALKLFKRQMNDAEALNNVGYFLMIQGKPEEAIPYLQQAINKKPSYYKVANENLERALSDVRKNDWLANGSDEAPREKL